MNRTNIEWCEWTWNPIVGCSPASAGCANCYAAAIAKRFGTSWGQPVFRPERLEEPKRYKQPGRIFVCSMSDIGHEQVDPLWRAQIRKAMEAAPWHTYIVLTKRPQNLVAEDWSACWVGVTAENQAAADLRLSVLRKIPAQVRFVSVEPMLEAVELDLAGIDWVIAGPETGPAARPFNWQWLVHLQIACTKAGVPFFDKRKHSWARREWPEITNA